VRHGIALVIKCFEAMLQEKKKRMNKEFHREKVNKKYFFGVNPLSILFGGGDAITFTLP
jgi:hypothetical protein